jgi:CRISPR/Cas system-associated endonuclease Cas1
MLLLSSGKLLEGSCGKAVYRVVDSVFPKLDQLNDRKYRTLQNEINAL